MVVYRSSVIARGFDARYGWSGCLSVTIYKAETHTVEVGLKPLPRLEMQQREKGRNKIQFGKYHLLQYGLGA